MKIRFSKLHGLGNDYLFLDAIADPALVMEDYSMLARNMSHRRLGPGADGIVILLPSIKDTVAMRIFNCDGSEAENCGNALRCIARLCRERNYASGNRFTIETKNRSVTVFLEPGDTTYRRVRVNIGRPCFLRSSLPMTGDGTAENVKFFAGGRDFDAACVSVGNPHCVVFQDAVQAGDAAAFGPLIETLPLFPMKINVGFCHVVTRSLIELNVWERGAGLTGACGTGAAAAFAACRSRNTVDPDCSVHMPGGSLDFHQDSTGDIHMIGPAVHVYDGIWYPDNAS
jgi:diaminopimelate epimerase